MKAWASARRAVTTHVRIMSTGQEHARVSRMGIHARRARILAVQPTTTALGLVRALATTLCATNAHTTVTSASIGVHAVVRVRVHVRIAPTSLLMLSTPNRVLSIPMTVLGNALRCITSRTASVQAVRTSRAHRVRIALARATTAQVMDLSVWTVQQIATLVNTAIAAPELAQDRVPAARISLRTHRTRARDPLTQTTAAGDVTRSFTKTTANV